MMDREQLAWAAGFFDGEGHIGITGTKNKHLHIQVCQTEEGPLERLKAVLGVGKIYGPYNATGLARRPYKQYHIDTFERVQHAICLMWPWLSRPKREQAKAAFSAYREYLARPYVPRGPKPKTRAT